MKKAGNKRGFTLIELLVVVLIIGILAAVAVPQYQKAVWKSRFTALKTITQSIAQAEEIYYITNGSYTSQLDDLDITLADISSCNTEEDGHHYCYVPWGACRIANANTWAECILYKDNNMFLGYKIMFNHAGTGSGQVQCWARSLSSDNDIQIKICQSETGSTEYTWTGTNAKGWVYP